MAGLSGNIEYLTFTISGVSQELKVVRFTGYESLSSLFRYNIELACEDEELDFATIVGESGLLSIFGPDDTAERYVHGIVNHFEQAERGRRLTTYYVELVPQLQLLTYRQDCRIFQDISAPDIIEEVLKGGNILSDQYELVIHGSYAQREYCVQYRETDFQFISRLMEEEGIFYFFKHSNEEHKLIIADNDSVHDKIAAPAEIKYHERTGTQPDEDSVSEFSYAERVRPGAAVYRDFNFKKPSLNLESKKEYEKDVPLEIYDFPGKYDASDIGDQRTGVQLEALQVKRKAGRGTSDCKRFIAGFKFTLTDHSRSDFNQEYLITQSTSEGQQPQVLEEGASGEGSRYHNSFHCIPASVPYRADKSTPKPAIQGIQTAIVVGPGGEEIYTDEYGRVKVQFHWDRQGKNDEKSSCWIRVSQLWAGAGWGAIYLPRIGHEVIVDFIEGDPDRPLITGRVYHGTNRPPYPLPDKKTQSTIKSNSSKGGGGSNEIRFEDKKGEEEIFIHAQKDENIVVGNDQGIVVGNDRAETIGHDRKLEVGNNKSEKIGSNKTIQVGASHEESIGANMSISVASTLTESVGINYLETVGAAMELAVGGALTIAVGGAFAETVGAAKSVAVGGTLSETVGGSKSITTGKDLSVQVGKNHGIDIAKDADIKVGGKKNLSVVKEYNVKAQKIQFVADDELKIKVGQAQIVMKKNGDIEIKGKKINIKGSGDIVVKGSKIQEN